jgi:hypothetical protein
LKDKVIELLLDEFKNGNEYLIYGCTNENAIKIIVEKIFYKILKYNNVLVYGACFSEERDLLSQWCKYANDGQGVAIGFNVDVLRNIADFGNSDYDDEDILPYNLGEILYIKNKDDIPHIYFDYANEIAEDILDAIINNDTKTLLDDSANMGPFLSLKRIVLLQDSVYMKDHDFTEEKEWRITYNDDLLKSDDSWWDISQGFNNPDKSTSSRSNKPIYNLFPNGYQFRATQNDIISYLDLDFGSYKDEIINEIVIGTNCKLTCDDITQLLLYSRYEFTNELEINPSTITFRK